jgi:D-alanine-D-alanine ligase
MVSSTNPRPIYLIHNDAGEQVVESVAEAAVLEAVDAMESTLRELGRPVVRLLLKPPLSRAAAALEALPQGATVFNLFEGFPEDPASEVQVGLLLQRLGLRPTGCPPMAMHLGLHKDLCKLLLKADHIPVPEGVVLRTRRDLDAPLPFPFPAFLKPAANDASHGIAAANLVGDEAAYRNRAGELLMLFPGGVLAEPFLSGRELNCGVVETPGGTVVLPPSLVDYSELPPDHPPVLTFAAKWAPGSPVYEKTPTVCPAPVEPELVARVQDLALRAFNLLGCRGYARVDLREDAEGQLRVMELNPNPDISPDAGLAKQARALGWDYVTLVGRVVAAIEEGPPWISP